MASNNTKKKKRPRSPSFPSVDLETAIERAKQIFEKEQRHPVPFPIAAEHWDYKPTSSAPKQLLAALRQYGLATTDSSGKGRDVRITDLAAKLILDKRPAERGRALREAALSPKLFADFWDKWGASLPSATNAESYLTVEGGFTPSAAKVAYKAYQQTVEYAGLNGEPTLPGEVEDTEGSEDDPLPSGEGVVEQPTEQPVGASPIPRPGRGPTPRPGGTEEEYLRMRLAGNRTVRVLFHGPPPTKTEIEKLIAMLELSKDQYPDKGDAAD